MGDAFLRDGFEHHLWATERLLDACADLTPDQLATPCPGTYGPILDTIRHLVGADGWYLSFLRPEQVVEIDDEDQSIGFEAIRAAFAANARVWPEVVADPDLDVDADLVEHGDGWDFHAPTSLRLVQVIHHGTDHRSQVCTALTSLGIEPPPIDVWDWGKATGHTRGVEH